MIRESGKESNDVWSNNGIDRSSGRFDLFLLVQGSRGQGGLR